MQEEKNHISHFNNYLLIFNMSKIELKKSILSKKYLNIDGEALADPSKKIPLSLLNGLIYPEPQIPKRGYATTKP